MPRCAYFITVISVMVLLITIQTSAVQRKAERCWDRKSQCLFSTVTGTGSGWDGCWIRCACMGFASGSCHRLYKDDNCKKYSWKCECFGRRAALLATCHEEPKWNGMPEKLHIPWYIIFALPPTPKGTTSTLVFTYTLQIKGTKSPLVPYLQSGLSTLAKMVIHVQLRMVYRVSKNHANLSQGAAYPWIACKQK